MIEKQDFHQVALGSVLHSDLLPRANALDTNEYLGTNYAIMATSSIAIDGHEALESFSCEIIERRTEDAIRATVCVDHDMI